MLNIKKKNSRAQAWSMDLVMAVVVFMLLIAIFYSVLSRDKESKAEDFSEKSDLVAERLFEDTNIGLINNGELDGATFLQLAQEDYEELKAQYGITGEFCIFLEDAQGNLIIVHNVTGIGNSEFEISDLPCGQDITE
ncbi:MAG: hypothetical protein ABIC91_02135 [Nanoarchaeota archaeon]|nr:hypothetical protein [Nanoarchaeota archaeon]MBU1030161.1 hypothetical protein [Nanoarchaeota archaeon]MBU1849396.1 hypothetical protein [Nanoarchaeota archaeon]